MKILIEGQRYPVSELEDIYNDNRYYTKHNGLGSINSVGYYYSRVKGIIVYMLPKVFLNDDDLKKSHSNYIQSWDTTNTVFKKDDSSFLTVKELFEINSFDISFKHSVKYRWIRQISISFYKSLIEFKNRKQATKLLKVQQSYILNTNFGDDEYSYLDLVLSFVNFYKKNKNIILFHKIELTSNKAKKPKWEKTIRKSLPLINSLGTPVYTEIQNKKKLVNLEEELLCYYFSILNHFNEENPGLGLKIDKSYSIIKGNGFKALQSNGLSKLRKIKYRYFSDTLRRMYKLCEIYFDFTDRGNNKKTEEFISINKYNIVFEDMIDKLLTDERELRGYSEKSKNGITITDLKNNDDGKIIDHLYEDEGIIDTSNIFYIGDSKYYKPGNLADKLSIYKQFTYAKNIIQYNIDFFNINFFEDSKRPNIKRSYLNDKIKYRDEITEGYNLTPNFLLYGIIPDLEDFENDHLNLLSDDKVVRTSSHWPDKLFDRDTLFVHQYNINFLFVLSAYTGDLRRPISKCRDDIKKRFRTEFIEFFKNKEKSKFTLCEKLFNNTSELETFVYKHFKKLNGKCFNPNDSENKLIIACHQRDKKFEEFLTLEGLFSKEGECIQEFVFQKKMAE